MAPAALTIRERMLVALAAVLDGISDIEGLCVERNRPDEVGEYPTLVVIDGDQAPKEGAEEDSCGKYFTTTVVLEGYVQTARGENIGTAMNALYGSVIAALMADVHLGGLADDITEGAMEQASWDAGDQLTGGFSLIVALDYAVQPRDPTRQP